LKTNLQRDEWPQLAAVVQA